MFKTYGSLIIYVLGIGLFFLALSGKARWTLLFITFLLPLQNIMDQMKNFPFGKDFLDILIVATLIGWIINTLTARKVFLEKSALNIISVVLILYTLFTLWRGYFYLNYFDFFNFRDTRVQDWKNYCLFPILFLLILNNIKEEKWVWRVVAVMCLSMVLMNTYTLKQISWFSGIVSREKIHGTFVWLGPNEVAAFYNQYTILLLSVYFAMKRSLLKFLLLGIVCSNIFCVLFLFSRGAYIGLAAGLFFLFAFRKRVLLIPLLAILIFWQVFLPQEIQTRIEMTTNTYGELDTSAENRILIWEQSMDLFKTDPLVGMGFGVFRYLGFTLKDTHNIYLKIMAEQGIIGLLIFLTLFMTLMAQGWRLYKRGNNELSRALGLGFVMCLITALVNNMFGDRWTYLPLGAYLWIFAGLVVRLNVLSRKTAQARKPIREKMRVERLYVQTA